MSGGGLIKQEFDYTAIVDTKLQTCNDLIKQRRLKDALEILLPLEKQTRTASDMHSTARVLVAIVKYCFELRDLDALNENIQLLCKKRSQLKQAITKMIQEACLYVDQISDMTEKLKLIDTLRTVTAGKIYVEIERARLTRKLAAIKESNADIDSAASILQELQVETYGSMEKREKIEFLLEQMRLCLLRGDYIRAQIISRKISIRAFEDVNYHDLKLKYYEYMIKLDQSESSYLSICKHFKSIYDTPVINSDPVKMKEALKMIVIYLTLAPYNNEQNDFLHRLITDKNLEPIVDYFELLKLFKTDEIINWRHLLEHFAPVLKSAFPLLTQFNQITPEVGLKRVEDFKARIVEHNLRVIGKFYIKIHTARMATLLDLSGHETEEFLSSLVINKTVLAKIDRPSGIVTFQKQKEPNEVLNDWSSHLNLLMNTINKTTHLINKEEMVHSAQQQQQALTRV